MNVDLTALTERRDALITELQALQDELNATQAPIWQRSKCDVLVAQILELEEAGVPPPVD